MNGNLYLIGCECGTLYGGYDSGGKGPEVGYR